MVGVFGNYREFHQKISFNAIMEMVTPGSFMGRILTPQLLLWLLMLYLMNLRHATYFFIRFKGDGRKL